MDSAAGATVEELANRYGRKVRQILVVLGGPCEAEKRRAYQRLHDRARYIERHTDRNAHNINIFEPHKPRSIKRVIAAPEVIREATRLFAASEISRAELSYRIRGMGQS